MRTAGLLTGIALIALMGTAPAQATLVTSLPDGTLVPIPAAADTIGFGAGPHVFGPAVTWSSTSDNSVFGYTNAFGYGFGGNGFWNTLLFPMAGLNDGTGTMTFAFSSPVAGVGGFVNYVPNGHPARIAIFDSAMGLLDSFDLTFTIDVDFNGGEFLGFLQDEADISYFTVSDNYVGITDFTVQGSPTAAVPEPGTMLLLGAGMAVLATRRRRA
jgi:hypothetical protein